MNVAKNQLTDSNDSTSAYRWAGINLMLVSLIWGINIPAMKYALGNIDEYLFNALRLTFSSLTLGVLFLWLRPQVFDRSAGAVPVRRQLIGIVGFSLLTGLFYQVMFLIGIHGTSGGNTALILATIPMWTAILARIFLDERLSRIAWFGLSVALAGTLMVTLGKPGSGSGTNTLFGNLMVLAAALSWAIGSVWSRPILRNTSPIALAFFSVAGTLPVHYLIAGNSLNDIPTVVSDPVLILIVAGSGIFSTGIAYAMWNFGVQQAGAARAAIFQNLVPVIAMLGGWLILRELPYRMQVIGGAMILCGLLLVSRSRHVRSVEK